jgi:hypothetical protein
MVTIMLVMTLVALATTYPVRAANYEDNSTNVGVYVNHLSACNLNHATGNMLCLNSMFESVIQYHDVRDAVFCPYHYCVLFRGDSKKVTCTGYVYLKMSGTMDEYLNPLTPNASNVKFTGNPDDDFVKVGTSLLNYNILIDRFEQSVETSVVNDIAKVTCMKPYSTCLEYVDGTDDLCFGAKGVVFHGILESALLGLVVPGLMAFVMYVVAGGLYKDCLIHPCFTVISIPLLVTICCMLILFVASDFIVKIYPFLFASIFGIILGFLCARALYSALDVCKQTVNGRVDDTYGTGGETTGMINANDEFVIGDDDDDDDDKGGLTEIELGTPKNKKNENI